MSVFQIDINKVQDRVYYILPVNSCEQCVLMSLEMLNNIEKISTVTIVFVSSAKNKRHRDIMKQLEGKFEVLLDMTSKIYDYETGIGKPLLIHIKNGKPLFVLEIQDNQIQKANDYLRKVIN